MTRTPISRTPSYYSGLTGTAAAAWYSLSSDTEQSMTVTKSRLKPRRLNLSGGQLKSKVVSDGHN